LERRRHPLIGKPRTLTVEKMSRHTTMISKRKVKLKKLKKKKMSLIDKHD
jgi:hypothetical protein